MLNGPSYITRKRTIGQQMEFRAEKYILYKSYIGTYGVIKLTGAALVTTVYAATIN